ncbi:DNA repair protein RadC [Roseateles asaccharophilus]
MSIVKSLFRRYGILVQISVQYLRIRKYSTLISTTVHPREVVKRALALGAGAAILAHNHPSGHAEPSRADELLTKQLSDALALVDVRVVDHLVVGAGDVVSFAERGLL